MSFQRTLTGGEADERRVPETMLECPECGDAVLRSRRDDHPHDLMAADDVRTAERQRLDDKVPDEARTETQNYRVEFTYEYREIVWVEAAHKSEAKWVAEEQQTHSGEYVDTLHTRVESWSEPTTPTLDYLETHGLLPDDHDVTQADIEAVMDA